MGVTNSFQHCRYHVNQLIQAALAAADPAAAVRRTLQRDGRWLAMGDSAYNLDQGRLFLISAGKAAVPMALAAAEVLGDDLASGIVITKRGSGERGVGSGGREATPFTIHNSPFTIYEGGHPVTNEASVRATAAAIHLLSQTTVADLVLCLISGGASALLAQPRIPLSEWRQLNEALLASGCAINDFNTVRRRLDRVKGGGLARLAAPAACVSLILSDVVGNPLTIIGSGPTVPGTDTPADALAILNRYHIASVLEPATWQRISESLPVGEHRPQAELHPHNHNLIIGDVRQAALAALARAAELGFSTHLLSAHLEGEAREVGRVAAAIAKDTPPGHCLILAGETTVTVRGDGRGGRNQEGALAAAIALSGWPNTAIAAFATDGEDGPTDAAGAVVSGETAACALSHDLDPIAFLARNDSYTFFKQLDKISQAAEAQEARENASYPHLIQTGSTGTNVNDLLFILTYQEVL